jgi:hypothetical protein
MKRDGTDSCRGCSQELSFFLPKTMLEKSAAWVSMFPYVYFICYMQKQGQAHFDSSTVDNMRRLLEHAGVPGHIYPLSLLCYEVMPPPQQVLYFICAHRTCLSILAVVPI